MNKPTIAGLALVAAVLTIRRRKATVAGSVFHKSRGILKRTRVSWWSGPRVAEQTAERYMMYVIMPAWSLAGALDWLWHRQTKIETTSGVEESLTHQLMMVEAGVPVFAGLFLEANAALFTLLTAGMLLHQLTAIWDVDYTVALRKVPAREQHTHTFMETIPFDIWAVLACLHPQQFLSMLGLGDEKPDFHLRLKRPPLAIRKVAALIGATTMFVVIPHLEELSRCWRAREQGLQGKDSPECARELYAS